MIKVASIQHSVGLTQHADAASGHFLQAMLSRRLSPRQQLREIVIHAGRAKIRLALEGLADVAHPVFAAIEKLDDTDINPAFNDSQYSTCLFAVDISDTGY